MASTLPASASQAEIENELDFLDIMIGTLDQGADDYATRLDELEGKKSELEERLEALLQGGSPSQTPPDEEELRMGGMDGAQDTAMTGGQMSPSNNMGIGQFYNGLNGGIQPGLKRSATDTLRLDSQHPYKRQTPDPSTVATPSSSVESFEKPATSVAEINERSRRRQLMAEAALQRQRDSQKADEEYARRLSQLATPSSSRGPGASSFSSSQRPSVQTTLNHNGSYQRLPAPQVKPERPNGASQFLPNQYKSEFPRNSSTPTGFSQAQARSPYVKPEHVKPEHIKAEPSGSRPSQPSQPRRKADVVDLTASDSDDGEEISEIAPNGFTPNNRTQRSGFNNASLPGFGHPLAVRPAVHSTPARPQIPGAYPTATPNGYNSVYGGFNGINPQQAPWLQQASSGLVNGIRTAAGHLGDSLSELTNLFNTNDDLIYGGSRSLLNPYAENMDLFNRRYNEIADYNPEKTREEINALLENIRPDEAIPADLRVKTPAAMDVKLHKYQEMGLTWLKNCEEGSNKGGILADEMGLGKTIQMLSLIVEHKSDDPRCKASLIVAPVALMRQWKQEIQQKIKKSERITVFIQHGQGKKKKFADLQHFDVVLTTFGTLASELKKLEKFRLRQKHDPTARPQGNEQCALLGDDATWYRVVLDEAQCIKNKTTKTAIAAAHLNSKYRFCMTGTPMMNNVEEFYSLVKFLRINPYSRWEKFRVDISTPLKSHDEQYRQSAMVKLQTLCKAIMLRRTKQSKFEGQPILVLPERTTDVENPVFDDDERAFYDAVENKTRLEFNKYLRRGQVGNNYTAVLVLLLRMRQAACHPHLIKDFGIASAADITEEQVIDYAKELDEAVVARIKATGGNFECPVCYDVVENPAIFVPCGHDTCRECFSRITDPSNAIRDGNEGGTGAKCPNCRSPIDTKRVTDFDAFKKVHMPELLTEEELKELEAMKEDDSSTESESESDDEEEYEKLTKQGNLDNFVEDDESTESEAEEDNDVEEEGASGPSKKSKKAKGKKAKVDKKSAKGKGKGKAKEKKVKKKKKKETVTLADLATMSKKNQKARRAYLRRLRDNYVDSAKIRKTMELLQTIIDDAAGEKVLVFSQWTSLLDLLEIPIDGKGWGYRRYDGSMNTKMRGDAVDDFRDDRQDVRIMLVSLKAGNAGLNLNMASQVIILDPFWSKSESPPSVWRVC